MFNHKLIYKLNVLYISILILSVVNVSLANTSNINNEQILPIHEYNHCDVAANNGPPHNL